MKPIRITDNSIRTLQQHDEITIAQTWNYCYLIENLEQELGIDLITLFKALKNGIWTKGGYYDYYCYLDNKPKYIKGEELLIGVEWYSQKDSKDDYTNIFSDNNSLCIFTKDFDESVYITRLQDYGKTWSLEKEELENDKH